jgi:uncharacterized protein (TIGR02246 family)
MAAREPAQLSELYCAAFNARDLDAIVALYAPDALLMRPGREVRGLDAIRAAFAETLATTTIAHLALVGEDERRSGKSCLVISHWSVERRRKDGSTATSTATTLEVCQLQGNGDWKIAIDDPIVLNG